MAALAQLAPDPGLTALRLTPAPAPRCRLGPPTRPPGTLGLPPGSLPLAPVSAAIASYRAGALSDDQLIATVDRHGDDLELEVGHQAIAQLADFNRAVGELEALHALTVERIAQASWLRRWPWEDTDEPLGSPFSIELGGVSVEIPVVLVALRTVQLPERLVREGSRPRPGRTGGRPRRRRAG